MKEREGRWERDLPAYKRLRDNGTQPRCIDGCAELETKAESSVEIEAGLTNIPRSHRSQVAEAVEMSKQMGLPA